MSNSIFVLSNKKVKDAQNLEVIKINHIDIDIDFDSYDTIIFSSKNSVYAINNLSDKWKEKDIYSIGKATTKAIESFDKKVLYQAKKSYGNDFAYEIIEKLKNKKVLYLRAKKVLSKLVDILKENNINIDQKVIYETVCNKFEQSKKPPKNSIIIFSSPSTIECFLSNFQWDDSYFAIVIGTVTAQYLPKNIKYQISSKQTIEDCVEIAKKIECYSN
jgi:uroporphyrinogen-III synthase